ncbi:MAG TPA: proton-conducting transporter membrane subunit [Candidatus Binatia bacterium]|nr:proton-conducting transporter membrane subunit [Candidatus Binatia bacterium]
MIFSTYPLLILFAPLAAGLIVGLLGNVIGHKVARVGVAAEAVSLALSLLLFYDVTTGGPQTSYLGSRRDGILEWGLYVDRLSAVMLVHIAAVSILIHLFSIRYMQQERGYTRFHSLLAFTTFVLFGMVASPNILMLFVFWQLLSWLVPLLSYNYAHPPTVRGAFRTFIMQRFGDVAFLAAVVVAYGAYGTLDFRQLFARAAEAQIVFALWPGGLEMRAVTAVGLLIFIGAMSKSAQFPLHMWLPDSLYAPTPVHALLHAGIINAGGFLLSRLAPLYALSPNTMHVVFVVGMLTALLGSSMMLVQNDIKKTLGYSTIGQMGFMIMECGLGAYGLAIFHLIAHGLFKGTIFLNCGYVIHAARQEPRSPSIEGPVRSAEFSTLTWVTGFVTTLILPLTILLAAHGILNIPLRDSQGTAIFLFFGWATSSQAILTLYRLKAVASWKVAVAMLGALSLVVVTYLFAAESFTHYLFPGPGEVTGYFRAGALPVAVFDVLVAAFALVIVFGWMLIYAASHGRTFRTPHWVDSLQVSLYLLLINRLYLDAVSLRLCSLFTPVVERTNDPVFTWILASIAAVLSLFGAGGMPELAPAQIVQLIAVALTLPLFPLHGPYIAALSSRAGGYTGVALALALPAAGLYGLASLSPELPPEALRIVNVLALTGALYASIKALAQVELARLLAYASLALYSVVYWHLAATGNVTFSVWVYVAALSLLMAGLLLAWQRLRRRCGELTIDQAHGLARPMPRFAVVVSLLVMAAVGLPPFALFLGQIELLLRAAGTFSWGLPIILFTWFLASWYLFRMMQRLLFGPHRLDLRYEDLRANEVAYFAALLALVAFLGFTPPTLLESKLQVVGHRTAMEGMPWQK